MSIFVNVIHKVRAYIEGRTYDQGEAARLPKHLVDEHVHTIVSVEAAPEPAVADAVPAKDAT